MSSDWVIRAEGLGKSFPVYRKAHHRLMQMLAPGPENRWYEEFDALRGVDLEIHRGETVGIVGRNGSGKSTLLQMICGTLTPSRGDVQVRGRIAALLELGAGFNPEFTGRENVFLNGTVLGLTNAEIEARFDDIAAFADIGPFMEQPVKTYSSGMYVRLAFAVAINVTPEVLVVDEALSVGDEAFQRKCFAKINEIRDNGATILFVSHSAGTVIDLCDRAILLDAGELLTQGAPKHVVSLYQKLVYAPADRTDAIRSEIRRGLALADAGSPAAAAAADAAAPQDALPLAAADPTSFWEEGLVPASTILYETKGARIGDPRLETPDGRRVNVVSTGGEYVYRYRVVAERSLVGVRCGMMIKTKTGIDVAGTATAAEGDCIPVVEAGSTIEVAFRFRCALASGTYFLNAGVLAREAEGEDYVDRQIDVAMFRVLPSRLVLTGLVDLDFEASAAVA
ncbi:ABC transporter ATP-binding protein [Lysobacter sp. TY2-98]|uniref:ABC transporter ATP-binding protein n=1 Tax=Lysobacter sp. TY2-98 TaxID=2290922 RepID=UPI000E20690D|nr:ABC transporter ATP-binding protein [Lysobacter sp. TY2-98]AXK70887.1 ABC transporter ATP-binding protein [Lysobacter sp. TY2-98]